MNEGIIWQRQTRKYKKKTSVIYPKSTSGGIAGMSYRRENILLWYVTEQTKNVTRDIFLSNTLYYQWIFSYHKLIGFFSINLFWVFTYLRYFSRRRLVPQSLLLFPWGCHFKITSTSVILPTGLSLPPIWVHESGGFLVPFS